MTSEKKLVDLAEFEQVLDTFGANPARWPDARRAGLSKLVASDDRARRLLREAEALDAMLNRAAGPPTGDTRALADRIANSISNADGATPSHPLSAGRPDATSAKVKPGIVIAWPRKKPVPTAPLVASVMPIPRRDHVPWRSAALMAASLLVGIFVGAMDVVPSNVTQLVAGIETTSEAPRELALLQGDDILDFIVEVNQ